MRPSKRKNNQIRDIEIIANVNKYAEGSCLIKCGNTHILCTATIEEKVPPFLRGKKTGWLTAEYSMLPRSTHTRNQRQNSTKPNGRSLEIQRLIGRSLRSTLNFDLLGERQIIIDCDVLQADGGTRCAAISGGYVALKLAIKQALKKQIINCDPIKSRVLAISCGIYNKQIIADLDYQEDSNCEIDANFILNNEANIIEIQATAEKDSFTFEQMQEMYKLAKEASSQIILAQDKALNF